MQQSFSDLEYAAKKKQTRRERFLGELEQVVPWKPLLQALGPHYYRQSGAGRPPIGLERMLRMYIAQQCFGLSDEGIEDAVYDSHAIRQFVGLDLGVESAPDATTLLQFRHLLERQGLTGKIFDTINAHLSAKGLLLREGTIVDATLIAAPSSTKNQTGERDPAMKQTKKGNQWHFGMKAHIGVDAQSGLVHSMVTTSANESDVVHAHAVLHGEERVVVGDAGYTGIEKRPEHQGRSVNWHVALRPGKRKALPYRELCRLDEQLEKLKASIRAKVEHPFHIIKNRFLHRKARYRGLAKNHAQLQILFALANLMIAKRRLLGAHAHGG
jgi:IS5 family transposase